MSTIVPRSGLLTDNNGRGPNRRLRVDVAQTGFFAGREGRTWHEMNITGGTDFIVKAVCPVDFILFDLDITITQGELKAYTLLADGTEGGTFSTTLPVISTNTMTSRPTPYYSHQMVLTAGGTYTDGTEIDLVWLKTDTNSNRAVGVGAGSGTERGVIAGTYYYRLKAIGGTDVLGTFKGRWEERPAGI